MSHCLHEVGASVEGERCKPIDPRLLARADRVVVLSRGIEGPSACGSFAMKSRATYASWKPASPAIGELPHCVRPLSGVLDQRPVPGILHRNAPSELSPS